MIKFILLLIFCLLPRIAEPALIDNVISHWKLEESSGDADDAHGDNDGTFAGNLPTPITGKIDNGQDFDGDADVVTVADDASLKPSRITVSTWIKTDVDPTGDSTNQMIVDRRDGSTGYYLYLRGASDEIWFQAANNERAIVAMPGDLQNNWYHLVGTYDETNIKLYVNGSIADTEPYVGGLEVPAATLHIGLGTDGSTLDFNGIIDEVTIWNRALDATEISDLYNQGNGLAYPFDGIDRGLVSYWKLDDNLATSAVLDAHNANNGTVVNDQNQRSSEQSTTEAKIVRAFALDGTNDSVLISTGVVTSTPYTICAWFYVIDKTTDRVIAELYQGGSHWATVKADSGGTLQIGIRGGGSSVYTSSSIDYTLETWHFACGVFAADDDRTIYLDAGNTGSSSTSVTPEAFTETDIGIAGDGGTYFFNGIIDEVGIWNRALTPAEITSLYNSGSGLAYPFTAVAAERRVIFIY